MHSKLVLVSAITSILTCGCASFNLNDGKIKVEIPGVTVKNPLAKIRRPGLWFNETPLYGLFKEHPYDTQVPFEQQFPRVAITVLEVPPFHRNLSAFEYTQYTKPTYGCWKIKAKIWRTRSDSLDVGPFTFCSPDDIVFNMPFINVDYWASGGTGTFGIIDESTGNRRTEGPVPPKEAAPSDIWHQRFWGSPALSASSVNGAMFGSMLYQMGFDWSISQDRRVWIVEFSEAGAPKPSRPAEVSPPPKPTSESTKTIKSKKDEKTPTKKRKAGQ